MTNLGPVPSLSRDRAASKTASLLEQSGEIPTIRGVGRGSVWDSVGAVGAVPTHFFVSMASFGLFLCLLLGLDQLWRYLCLPKMHTPVGCSSRVRLVEQAQVDSQTGIDEC